MAKLKRESLRVVNDAASEPREESGVATMLRDARLSMGVDLREAAETLRIRYPYLEAIENGRFGDLPGATYALGFVRAYADYLRLDSREIVRLFKEESQGLSRRTALVFPEPLEEGRFPGARVLIMALILAGAAYGGWYYWYHRPERSEGVPPVPADLAAQLPKPETPAAPAAPAAQNAGTATATTESAAASATSAAPNATAPSSSAAAAPATAPSSAPSSPVASAPMASTMPGAAAAPSTAAPAAAGESKPAQPATSAEASAPAAASSAPAETGAGTETTSAPIPPAPEQTAAIKANEAHSYGESNTDSRVTLTATKDSWVQIRDKDSNVIWTRILHPGDTYKVPNQPGLTLLTGNAGALEVTVDGKQAPSLGAMGLVRRNVSLDPARLAAGTAVGQ